ncbi:hypothetical protein O181_009516 [Austropuccinia psidii MF-1]|uniref:Uncharacterized protein n=1 Tax=Austropuccinia psidii MF-1 TaxID=1389203 RepID=A0A9Q3BPF5_9BASI|nr:hypothetical protein [Austropuccinia psidii MF-1]
MINHRINLELVRLFLVLKYHSESDLKIGEFAGCCLTLKPNGSNYPEWLSKLNYILSFIFENNSKINDSKYLLSAIPSSDHCPVTHFIYATIPKDLSITLGVPDSPPNPLSLFHAIQARFSPGNHFQKLALIRDLSELLVSSALAGNARIQDQITNWRNIFSMKCCLNIQDDELEGLFLQLNCVPPPPLKAVAFDQLVSSTIISSLNTLPSAAFVSQIITNSAVKMELSPCNSSPFINCLLEPHQPSPSAQKFQSCSQAVKFTGRLSIFLTSLVLNASIAEKWVTGEQISPDNVTPL